MCSNLQAAPRLQPFPRKKCRHALLLQGLLTRCSIISPVGDQHMCGRKGKRSVRSYVCVCACAACAAESGQCVRVSAPRAGKRSGKAVSVFVCLRVQMEHRPPRRLAHTCKAAVWASTFSWLCHHVAP